MRSTPSIRFLETLSRVAAPLAPLITEEVWRGITGGESVHLTNWPKPEDFPEDAAFGRGNG